MCSAISYTMHYRCNAKITKNKNESGVQETKKCKVTKFTQQSGKLRLKLKIDEELKLDKLLENFEL